jgi:hypothetical protein
LSTVLFAAVGVSLLSYCVILFQLESAPTPEHAIVDSGLQEKIRVGYKPRNKDISNKIPLFGVEQVKDRSSVDYMACCGLGHRVSKLAEANYLAKMLGFGLRAFWGYCDAKVEVFHYLFGKQPVEELVNVTDLFRSVRVNNDVPGFWKLIRKGVNETCACSFDKEKEDVRFYRSMRERFRLRDQVDAFRRDHFFNATVVVGMHIRAGNGETGHFTSRNRVIGNEDEWAQRVVGRVLNANWGDESTALFVATDTPSMIDRLRTLLKGRMKVITYDQETLKPGTGVMFGERGKVVNTGATCLQGWEDSVMDMLLLSYADVVVAARPSSFVQSMPMSLVLATPEESRKVSHPYCEFNPSGEAMQCYKDYRDWCCTGKTSYSLEGMQRHDYIRMPPDKIDKKKLKLNRRDREGCIPRPEGWKQMCLPYDWKNPTL